MSDDVQIDGVQVWESGNVLAMTFVGRQWGLRIQNTGRAQSGCLRAFNTGNFSKVKQLLPNASTIEFAETKIFPPFAACQRAKHDNLFVDLIYPKDSSELTADVVISEFRQLFS